jgi:hypothetical protein
MAEQFVVKTLKKDMQMIVSSGAQAPIAYGGKAEVDGTIYLVSGSDDQ